ncbi:hypothetical protein ABLN86_07355, partial [Mycobacterium tuberculosis]
YFVQLLKWVFNQVYLANTTGFHIYRETLSRFHAPLQALRIGLDHPGRRAMVASAKDTTSECTDEHKIDAK